ncbi:MAG TPA: hypothetical protein VIJ25_01585 [Methylococcales bacterium]
MAIEHIDPNAHHADKPRTRKGRLQKRLREINALGEQELAAIMENLEKIKAAFRKENNTK